MFGVIISIVAILGFLLYLFVMDRNSESEVPHYRQLLQHMSWERDFESFHREHQGYTEYRALKEFFTPARMEIALAEEERREKANHFFSEEAKKERIMNRIYGYEYEGFLFSLFAPFAIFDDYSKNWKLPAQSALPFDYVVYRIGKEYNFSKQEATLRLWDFEKKRLLFCFVNNKWCSLGSTLKETPNIVSANDLNLSSWIERNGKPMTAEQLKADFLPYSH